MNTVLLIGRLTKDPEIRYKAGSQTAISQFSIAIDRGRDNSGNNVGTDYPNIVCFGRTAEMVDKFLSKGRLVGIQGRIHTGSYEKNGQKVYTTEVVADRVEFLDKPQNVSPIFDRKNPDFEPAVDWQNGFTDDVELPF